MTILATLLAALASVVVGALLVMWAGLVDPAATRGHLPGVGWLLHVGMERGVAARVGDVPLPDDLGTPERIQAGLEHYAESCEQCHGGPGAEPEPFAEHMNPDPPVLHELELEAAETRWIVEHGIRMTGMPAFGPTHDDDELWDLTAAVLALPRVEPHTYATLTGGEHNGHEHDRAAPVQDGGRPEPSVPFGGAFGGGPGEPG